MVLLAGDTKPFLNFDWAYEHKIQQHRSQPLHATTQAECSNCSGSTCEDSDTECILHYSALFYTFCLLFYVFSSKFATIPCLFLAHWFLSWSLTDVHLIHLILRLGRMASHQDSWPNHRTQNIDLFKPLASWTILQSKSNLKYSMYSANRQPNNSNNQCTCTSRTS